MAKSLLEQSPAIVAAGRRQAVHVLEQLDRDNRVSLQVREVVIPSKDTAGQDLFAKTDRSQAKESVERGLDGLNRLIYGDNLLAMAALLAGGEVSPSLRGKIDLVYIDPPFDSKADYRSKILADIWVPLCVGPAVIGYTETVSIALVTEAEMRAAIAPVMELVEVT